MKLTIIIPVYNEEKTIVMVLKKVLKTRVNGWKKEIIVINDGSSDATALKLKPFKQRNVKIITQKMNMGKGAAIRKAIELGSGDAYVIQDADLEYNPDEYSKLLGPIRDNKADVVYGSRFISHLPHRVLYFWHMLGNSVLTLITNMVTNLNLSDMETCYKAFTRKVAKNIILRENRFGFEPEFTIKTARMGCRIYEVGISYYGRTYAEGKKIGWKDGIQAVLCILKYGVGID